MVDAGIPSYTPATSVDHFEIADLTATSAGTMNYNVDDGANTLLTRTNATAAYAAVRDEAKPPKIYGWSHSIGTNDKSTTMTAGFFEAELINFITRIRADFPDMTTAKFVMPKVNNPSATADATTVINAQAARATADVNVKIVNTDAYNRWDTTH